MITAPLLEKRLRGFHPKHRLYIENGPYVIKTAESSWELETALRLRHAIFYKELLNQTRPEGIDMDDLDAACDHLIVMEKTGGALLGTYRLVSSSFSARFFAADRFDISQLLALPGTKLELGRACVAPGYRSSAVFSCLWRGICAYLDRVNARYVFGCPSILSTDPQVVTEVLAFLRIQGYVLRGCELPALPHVRFPYQKDAAGCDRLPKTSNSKRLVPPLLRWYLKEGARVSDEPALDRHFQCTNLIALMDTTQLRAGFRRRFSRASLTPR